MTITAEDQDNDDKWGYDMYPERKGQSLKRSWLNKLFYGSETYLNLKCEFNVYDCVMKSPIVKLMVAALNSSGCSFDMRRHISCEMCGPNAAGGYDPRYNQIVICQNNVTRKNDIEEVLAHELLHMFDYCRNEFDFKNLDHTACTEVRAINLFNCSYFTALFNGSASIFRGKERTHRECVKKIAKDTLLSSRDVTETEAVEAINRVFPKCYQDLEPVGRRIRKRSDDMKKAYEEAHLYGYDK